VSQNLGIQLKYLAKYNELDENEHIPQGLVVWVQEKRPKHIDPEIRPLAKKEEKPKETPQKEEVIKQSDIEIVVQKPEENIVVEEGFYLVKEDDESIFEIARKHNVNVLDLKAWNNLPIDLSLKKGQILRVAPPVINEDAYKPTHQNINDPENPINLEKELGTEVVKNVDVKVVKDKNTTTNTNTTPSKEPAYEQITHIVKSGETLTSIAMQYNVKPEDIITWNDLTSRSLDPDQYLIIKIPKNKSTPFVTPTQPTQEIDYHKPAITVEEKTTPTSASSVKKEVVVQNIRNEKGIRIHKVQRGEFPNRIAAAYGLQWQQIKEWTGLTDDNIREGMELIVENPQPFTKNRFDKPAIENKPTPTEQTKDKTPQPIYHTVKQGETMFRLTQMYKVSQEQIRKWNNLADNNIKIGMQYIVGYRNEEIPLAKEKESISEPTKPKKEENSTAAKPQYHKVQVGETLFSLAKKYGVSIEQIKKLNNIQNNVLVPGKEVRIR
ncbi:MAG: LysM peptidoglycan-binding domain-containing protein, partial [Flammeovirgaceae bacterium]|nr:LysM peptidoglycan-binding domain-containing protein [Flammeovirgaceae bacterium]MDW8287742.1 LysM peptidoglycan-binding domain-containing protein [Flammeovirgaceae bacterium]